MTTYKPLAASIKSQLESIVSYSKKDLQLLSKTSNIADAYEILNRVRNRYVQGGEYVVGLMGSVVEDLKSEVEGVRSGKREG